MEMRFLDKIEDNVAVRMWELFHFWKSGLGAHCGRIYDLASVSKDSS
ncbi:hypothetical protein Gogos_020649 [Gossypium gossypioides]|uniref:Uncharacterized protein n=1 Tax=Gossypium gossypioides TaxID=34282 RepID=A0A7J9D1Q9_GOSGO|nr:hypothetical protein [Gossypium gossypioides]